MENEKDVKPSETSTEEQVVNEVVTDQQPQTEITETPSASPEVKTESQVDERGVPMNNVYHEMNRKLSEQNDKINQLVSELQSKKEQPAQNTVSVEQLLWCIEDPEATPQAKFYARNELRKIDEQKSDQKLKETFTAYQEEQNVRQQRSQAFNWFSNNFPEAVLKDQMGNAVEFNSSHPLVQRIGEYMKDPLASKRGDALMIAAKSAAFDLGIVASKGLSKKLNQTTALLRKEQKKTLIAGSGVNPQEDGKSTISKVAEHYKNTQSSKSFKELAKKRGLIPQ